MRYELAIVGGGIVGLAHAWLASRQGRTVVLVERDRVGSGASVRNFGMIWPIGQPCGELMGLALRSRQLWLELAEQTGIWVHPCGSLHLARHEDELDVLGEFVELLNDSNTGELVDQISSPPSIPFPEYARQVSLVDPAQVTELTPAARQHGLLGALWSPTELCVNPPQAIAGMTDWLEHQSNVTLLRSTVVTEVDGQCLKTSNGERIDFEQAIVCSGSDFETLYPDVFARAGLRKCKLQMMATAGQPGGWKLGPHLAGGLTLRHYHSFSGCASLPKLQQRIAEEAPLLDRYGIHVMASQNNVGEVILGDSHEYDQEITPFDSAEIEQLMLAELRKLLDLPDFRIARRWHGVYAKHTQRHVLNQQVSEHVRIVTATGGAGMTLSLGLAEQALSELGVGEPGTF